MKSIFIINGHQKYDTVAKGELTRFYIDTANEFFTSKGFDVKNTHIEAGYDAHEEVKKFVWADMILFQYPVFWMGLPWITKRYIDEVFSAGQNNGIYISDGRSRKDSSLRYGSGGSLQGTKYMLSLTYNCPTSEFDDKAGFFDGLSIDQAHIATHKTLQFCGCEPLETYSVHDIFKGDLDLEAEKSRFLNVLDKNIEDLK